MTASSTWRRIGVPGLAYLLAAGNDKFIDETYVAVELAFTLLGAFWLSRYAQLLGRSAAWGLAFLLIPGVAVSLDRMTVDLPVAALTVAVLFYGSDSTPRWQLYAALVTAPLIRDTGLLLIFAWCIFRLRSRHMRDVFPGAASAVPALVWYIYVALHAPPDQMDFLASYPLGGLIKWTLHAVAELAALAGIWLAFILTLGIAVRRAVRLNMPNHLPEILALTFVLFASLLGYQDIWASAYGIGRTLSPLLIALAAIALRDNRAVFAVPMLLIVPRIALQFASEIHVAARAAS